MRTTSIRLTLALFVCLAVAGCSKSAGPMAAAPMIPDTPDGTVKTLVDKLANHQPEFVWLALPESYRTDINEITTTFAQKMDPQLYDRSFAVARRAVEVLQAKKHLILESETMARTQADPEEIEKALDSSLAVVETLFTSEITTLQGLQAVDWQNYLKTTGGPLMQQAAALRTGDGENPFAELETLEVELIEATDETAKLRLTVADEESEEVEMVRVEGRWVPAELARKWPELMADARQGLEEMTPEKMNEVKGQALMGLAMAEGVIEQMALIETTEEFDTQMGPMIQALMNQVVRAMPRESQQGL